MLLSKSGSPPQCETGRDSLQSIGDQHDVATSPRQKAATLIAKLRAAEVALLSIRKMLATSKSQNSFGRGDRNLVKSELDFNILKSILQRNLIALVEEHMETTEKLELLFSMFDSDQNNKLAEIELANVFQLIRQGETAVDYGNSQDQEVNEHRKPFLQAVEAAHLTIVAHDTTGEGYLNFDDFVTFLESMSTYLEDKNINEIADILIMDIASFYDEDQIIKECQARHKNTETSRPSTSRPSTSKTSYATPKRRGKKFTPHEEARLYLLFQLIDTIDNKEGNFAFKEVIEAMSPFSKLMDKEFRMMLFYVADDAERFHRKMDFSDFIQFFDTAMAACPEHFSTDHIANGMTAYLCQDAINTLTGNNNEGRMTYDDSIDKLLSAQAFTGHEKEKITEAKNKQSDKQRIRHLFNLWDSDNSQTLDVNELFMGFRKFQKSRNLDETLSDVVRAMETAQKNCTSTNEAAAAVVNFDQFEEIIFDFAIEVGVEIDELIDFMYMETIAKKNHPEESDAKEFQFVAEYGKKHQESQKSKESIRQFIPRVSDIFDMSMANLEKEKIHTSACNLPSLDDTFKEEEDDDDAGSSPGNRSMRPSTSSIASSISDPDIDGTKRSANSFFMLFKNLAQEKVDVEKH